MGALSCRATVPATPAAGPPTLLGAIPGVGCCPVQRPSPSTLTSREEAMEKARGRIGGMRSNR